MADRTQAYVVRHPCITLATAGLLAACSSPEPPPLAAAQPKGAITASARSLRSSTLHTCQVDGANAEDRDIDLYVMGLNHHGPDCASGTREEDLQNLASWIRRSSPDPSRIVIASSGSNPIKGGGLYVDLNACPADRLQHILEETYGATFKGVNGCADHSENKVILGADWISEEASVVQFGEGGDPDRYLYVRISHRLSGAKIALYNVRFATGKESEKPGITELRKRQATKLFSRATDRAIRIPTLVTGDFNFPITGSEADAFKPNVDWSSYNLNCGSTKILIDADGNSDIMNAVVVKPAIVPQLGNTLRLVGATYNEASGIKAHDICHPVIALRYRIERCEQGAFCMGACTRLGTRSNCSHCGEQCEGACSGGACDGPIDGNDGCMSGQKMCECGCRPANLPCRCPID